tara:strand:- start:4931 stop:5824 length:894 start_codon:yes stop_codon:yes gene_type:complete
MYFTGDSTTIGFGPNKNLTAAQESQREKQENKLIRLREEGHPWALDPANQKYYTSPYVSYDSGVVNINQAKDNIESGTGSEAGKAGQAGAPIVNAAADRERNQQSDMAAMLQQYGKVPLDPAGGGVMGAGLGMALSGGKLVPTLLGGAAGYLLAKSNTINLPKGKGSFNENQALGAGSQSEELYQEKAEISGIDPNEEESGNELAIAPGFTDAAANRASTFGQDVTTLLAQSMKTTGDDVQGGNMQPVIGGEPGLEATWEGGSPGNVVSPADELVASFARKRVPEYVFQTLSGGSVA